MFIGILLLTRCRVSLGIALCTGSIILELWANKTRSEIMVDFGYALSQPALWLLLLITALILEFGRFMSEDENAKTIMNAARQWGGKHGRAMSLMAIPAMIGLIPMPGGALFSAPFVQQTAQENHWSSAWKSAINYWFRHVWEYWWPVFPVVILTLSIFPIKAWQFTLVQLPFTIVAVVSGFVFLVYPHLTQLTEHTQIESETQQNILFLMLPLGIMVLCTWFLPFLLTPIITTTDPQIPDMIAMIIGMGIGLILIMRNKKTQKKPKIFEELFSKKTITILITLGGVMIFKSILERSGLLPAAIHDLLESGMPPLVLIIALIPFVAGFVTGVAIGFAGTVFPLIAGLLSSGETGLPLFSILALAFGFGYAGMMLSPVHLCFILTKNYFSTTYIKIYTQIFPCIVVLLFTAIGLHVLFNLLGW